MVTLISSQDSAHDFIVKFSPCVCVAVVASLTREVAVRSFAYHAHGTNPAVIHGHDKISNQQCVLTQAPPLMINLLTSTASDNSYGGASKTRNETKQKPHPQIYYFHTSASQRACNFSLWLAPSLNSVSEVRLVLFSVYFLLWQLRMYTSAYYTRVLPFSCMLTFDIFSS